jgi:hypothetical protein
VIVYKLHISKFSSIIKHEVINLENLVNINAVLADELSIKVIELLALNSYDLETLVKTTGVDVGLLQLCLTKLLTNKIIRLVEYHDGSVYALDYFLMQDLSDYYAWLCNKMATGCRECD